MMYIQLCTYKGACDNKHLKWKGESYRVLHYGAYKTCLSESRLVIWFLFYLKFTSYRYDLCKVHTIIYSYNGYALFKIKQC